MAAQLEEPPNYSIFFRDAEGKIKQSKRLRDCTSDEEAIAKALTLKDDRQLDLFDGCRLVKAFPAKA